MNLSTWIRIFHIFAVAGLMVHIGLSQSPSKTAYQILTILSFGGVAFHFLNNGRYMLHHLATFGVIGYLYYRLHTNQTIPEQMPKVMLATAAYVLYKHGGALLRR